MRSVTPVSVAVLVELERGPAAGGHVKCWERLAEAAAGRPEVDLTVYVLGRRGIDRLADNVRFVSLPPVLGAGVISRHLGGVDAADLAPFHPELARRLPAHQVWHVTHCLAFGATAVRVARRRRHHLVGSLHTDVPALTRHYVEQMVGGLPGSALRRAAQRLHLGSRAAALVRRRHARVFGSCARVLVANERDRGEMTATVGPARVSTLRRGIDRTLFSPDRGSRQDLSRLYPVPRDRFLIAFAGRLDASKGVPLLTEAVRQLLAAGLPVQLVLVGTGAEEGPVRRALGDRVTLLGHLPQPELARVLAACDVLAFPSRSETAGNVVAEAMACGLPVLLPSGARTARWLTAPGTDGVLVSEDTSTAWATALAQLAADPHRRRALGEQARATMVNHHPSWETVLEDDLLPVWRAHAGQDGRGGGRR